MIVKVKGLGAKVVTSEGLSLAKVITLSVKTNFVCVNANVSPELVGAYE